MSASQKILVTGGRGLLAPYLVEAATRLGTVVVSSLSGGDRPCDFTKLDDVCAILRETQPDIVIHSVGLTDVDLCEREPERAFAINCDAVKNLSRSLPSQASLVYISTDQVYPDTEGPHSEEEASPINVYGKSKFAGEKSAMAHENALVLRTNFFGPSRSAGRKSLSDFVVENLRAGNKITLFDDVYFSPLHMSHLGHYIVECLKRKITGIYNLGCREGATKADFSFAAAAHLGLQTETASIGASDQIFNRAPRPKDLRLDVSALEKKLGESMPTLKQEVSLL
ncbi:MAG: SDR family oxidoreductase [Nitrosopumilus sp.]|nr:SDR family oxidoreductase [Nitrosopumilus sp.]